MHHIHYKLKDGSEKSFTRWKIPVKRKFFFNNLFFTHVCARARTRARACVCVWHFIYRLYMAAFLYQSSLTILFSLLILLTDRITLKDVKAFLPRVNCKIATNRLRELFQEVDTRNRNEIGFDDFVILYHKLMFDQNVSKHCNTLI